MKKIFLLLLITPLLSLKSIDPTTKFIGKWTGEDKDEVGYILFDNEGYATFEIQGKTIGGKEFIMNGKKGKMTFKINRNVKPIEIDFTITKLETGEEKTLLCIAEFKDDNHMLFASNFDENRPTEFNETNSISLTRVE